MIALGGQSHERLAKQFQDFSTDRDVTPLYARLAGFIAEEPNILALMDSLPEGKRRPVTLFAAVHYLILKGESHPLSNIYSAPGQRALDDASASFSSFCNEFAHQLVGIMQSRSIQTNEVNRCSALLPAFMHIHRQSHEPLALVELGSSAGLNLLFDRFHYDYAGGPVVGPLGASVRCHSELRGNVPAFETSVPPVEFRVGIDVDPINIFNPDEVLWLRACVWAGDVGRDQRLTAAIELARRELPDVRKANVLDALAAVVDEIPPEQSLVLFNSWMMSWMSEADRLRLTELVAAVAARRPLWWVTYEWASKVPAFAAVPDPEGASLLGLQHINREGSRARVLAKVSHHGTWLDWQDPESSAD